MSQAINNSVFWNSQKYIKYCLWKLIKLHAHWCKPGATQWSLSRGSLSHTSKSAFANQRSLCGHLRACVSGHIICPLGRCYGVFDPVLVGNHSSIPTCVSQDPLNGHWVGADCIIHTYLHFANQQSLRCHSRACVTPSNEMATKTIPRN